MRDRRKGPIRTHTMTLGGILVVMGWYAFSPLDTLFTQTLSRLGVEEFWGTFLIAAGVMLLFSATSNNKYIKWVGNTLGSFAGVWTFSLCWTEGLLTPTVAACGVIGVGCLATMLRDAFEGKRHRCIMKQTGRWEIYGD